MQEKSAIIFAAGLASRLGDLSKNLPKACLELEDNYSILDRQIDYLSRRDFQKIFIISGHARNKIQETITKWPDLKIIEIFNPHYQDRNNIYSAWLASQYIGDQSLILNSDIVFHPEILDLAIKNLDSKESFMIIDNKNDLDEEDMKVLLDESNHIQRINKNLNIKNSYGEFIGMMRITKQDLQLFTHAIEQEFELKNFNKYYEDALDQICSQTKIQAIPINGLSWTEIDTIEDYNKARNLFKNKN